MGEVLTRVVGKTSARAWWAALALAGWAAGCGHAHFQQPLPAAPTDSDLAEAVSRGVPSAVEAPVPEDSAADQAALDALQELEFKGLGKGDDRALGVLPAPGLQNLAERDVNREAVRLFGGSRGGAASAAGPTYDIDVESFASHSRVQYYSDFFLGPARDRFAIWLTRMPRYEGMVRARFRSYGVPEDLAYLGLIESGYSNTAVSRAKAVGMWQFMSSTGRRYGLQVDQWVDERRDPFKATDAAAQHLLSLDSLFGSWYLAAAAYNGGTRRIIRGIRRLPGEADELSDETFFALSDRRYLRRETRDYVPKLIAAALIAKDPARFGFDSVATWQPLVYDEITVPDATGLDVIARLADTTTAALLELNPQYYRGVTPPGHSAIVRVPRGAGTTLAQRYADLPPGERVNFLDHAVARGETVGAIARRYRMSVDLLLAANPGVRARALRVGTRLKVPVSAAARGLSGRSEAPVRRSAPATAPASGSFHVVRPGETLWIISQHYGVTVGELRRWNDLMADDVLRVASAWRSVVPGLRSGGQGSPADSKTQDRLVVTVGGCPTQTQELIHLRRSPIVGQQRQSQVALVGPQQVMEVAETDLQVGGRVVQLLQRDARLVEARRLELHLCEADGVGRAVGPHFEVALNAYQAERQVGIEAFPQGGVVDQANQIRRHLVARRVIQQRPGSPQLQPHQL
jgi:membrane-bound lytic murein transglycosylase D